jgi:hypothetical protein
MAYMSLKDILTLIIVISLLKTIYILLPNIKKRWIIPAVEHLRHYLYRTAAYWTFVSIMVPLTIIQMILDDGGPPPYIPKSQRWKAKLLRWRSKFKAGCCAAPAQIIDTPMKWWSVCWKKEKKKTVPSDEQQSKVPTAHPTKHKWGMKLMYCMMASTRRGLQGHIKAERSMAQTGISDDEGNGQMVIRQR